MKNVVTLKMSQGDIFQGQLDEVKFKKSRKATLKATGFSKLKISRLSTLATLTRQAPNRGNYTISYVMELILRATLWPSPGLLGFMCNLNRNIVMRVSFSTSQVSNWNICLMGRGLNKAIHMNLLDHFKKEKEFKGN